MKRSARTPIFWLLVSALIGLTLSDSDGTEHEWSTQDEWKVVQQGLKMEGSYSGPVDGKSCNDAIIRAVRGYSPLPLSDKFSCTHIEPEDWNNIAWLSSTFEISHGPELEKILGYSVVDYGTLKELKSECDPESRFDLFFSNTALGHIKLSAISFYEANLPFYVNKLGFQNETYVRTMIYCAISVLKKS